MEQISFEARESEFIDNKSGVSARMSITAYENLLSTAERRALRAGDDKTTYVYQTLWVSYLYTGKVELVYEGEQKEAAYVAQNLIASAIHTFSRLLSKIELESQMQKQPMKRH
jgi:magnesium chelatase subunit I